MVTPDGGVKEVQPGQPIIIEKSSNRDDFILMAMKAGLTPPELLELTVDHIWRGGDPEDLKWVAKGLQQMGIRRDIASRLFHAWRSFLGKDLPEGLSV